MDDPYYLRVGVCLHLLAETPRNHPTRPARAREEGPPKEAGRGLPKEINAWRR